MCVVIQNALWRISRGRNYPLNECIIIITIHHMKKQKKYFCYIFHSFLCSILCFVCFNYPAYFRVSGAVVFPMHSEGKVPSNVREERGRKKKNAEKELENASFHSFCSSSLSLCYFSQSRVERIGYSEFSLH